MTFTWVIGAQRYAHLSVNGKLAAICSDRKQGFYADLVGPKDKRINHSGEIRYCVFETACPWQTTGWVLWRPDGSVLQSGPEEGEVAKKLIESLINTSEEWKVKIPAKTASMRPTSLSRKILRLVEKDLGIYLDAPVSATRSMNQQFGVFDEDEKHAGDIESVDRFFSEETLRFKIAQLFNQA